MLRYKLLVLIVTIALLSPQSLAEAKIQYRPTPLIPDVKENKKINAKENKNVKIIDIAKTYGVNPEYLYYILEVEKEFSLHQYSLLALIAIESGFKPQTHMDGGSLSYSTTQMKLPTAKTAYTAMTEYYKIDVPYPTHKLLNEDKYYATILAGGYLRYLNDVYKDDDYMETYTAYNWGVGGRMIFYNQHGHFKSPYATKALSIRKEFLEE